jgi:hypothetical protein
MEARIQTGALPAVGWSVLLGILVNTAYDAKVDCNAARRIANLANRHHTNLTAKSSSMHQIKKEFTRLHLRQTRPAI